MGIGIVKGHTPFEPAPDDMADVLGVVRLLLLGVAHATARAELHLTLVHVIAGLRKKVAVAGIIPMHVGQDDVLDPVGGDADLLETYSGLSSRTTRSMTAPAANPLERLWANAPRLQLVSPQKHLLPGRRTPVFWIAPARALTSAPIWTACPEGKPRPQSSAEMGWRRLRRLAKSWKFPVCKLLQAGSLSSKPESVWRIPTRNHPAGRSLRPIQNAPRKRGRSPNSTPTTSWQS
jgi:hypothetical protein